MKPEVSVSLEALARAEAECTRCPLYRDATQAVPGEGRAAARMMIVGEQPGNSEDRAGRPFVGPAGRVLDIALEEAGISRDALFVTNAVKHFKFAQRGKKRLHQRPNTGEISACKWWLDQERRLVEPDVLVAMGTTAIRGLFGKALTITSLRGKTSRLEDGVPVIVTVHPSHLLRIPDRDRRRAETEAFTDDLRRAWGMVDA